MHHLNSNYFSNLRFHSNKCFIDFSFLKDRSNLVFCLLTAMNSTRKLIGSQKNVNISKFITMILFFPNNIFISEIFIFLIVFLNFISKIWWMSCKANYIIHAANNFQNFSKKWSTLSDISVIEFLWELPWFVSSDFTVKIK